MNSAVLIADYPSTKAADSQLKTFQDQLVAEGQKRAKALEDKYAVYLKEAQGGTLTRVEMQAKETELQQGQQDLAAYEQEVYEKVAKKRQELYEPILQKVQAAIDEVGKAGNYQFIFDTSVMNVIVFAEESDDITELVKSKL
ncbi:MAG: OmpH family outer membrane protein [Phaeodactylibacter sp.]|nr:OmpH family outer membrane protein [Phaeodactylibacter sp.]